MSSLKQREQFSPDFTSGLLSKGYWQFVRMVPHHWTRWPPNMVKALKKSSPEPRKLWSWILVYSIGDSRSTKFVQVMVVGWPLTFLRQDQICIAGLGGSVGCTVQLETRRLRVQPPPRSATFFCRDWSWNIFYGHSLPSADSRRAVVSFWQKNVHNTG